MRAITITTTTSITDFIDAYWSNNRHHVADEREQIHYRNRTRWQNVMPAVVKALPDLWEAAYGPDWREEQADHRYCWRWSAGRLVPPLVLCEVVNPACRPSQCPWPPLPLSRPFRPDTEN